MVCLISLTISRRSCSIASSVSLSLKAGWNLVQVDEHWTQTGEAGATKIADKNIPWVAISLIAGSLVGGGGSNG
jgi:hypothetical protein